SPFRSTLPSRLLTTFVFPCYRPHPALHSFPTRRSSDLSISLQISTPLPSAKPSAFTAHRPPSEVTNLRAADGSSKVPARAVGMRSEEHTSELQSRENLVCRLLLEKKKKKNKTRTCRHST